MNKITETDVLIIGSGLAGLLSAIKLVEKGFDVALACKTSLFDSNTNYAQGGIAAPSSASKTDVNSQLDDTVKAGAGLVDTVVAQEIIQEGSLLIDTLTNYGVLFDHLADGNYALAKEGGHQKARVYHYQDITGKSISSGLVRHLKDLGSSEQGKSALKIYEHRAAYSLIMSNGTCCGAKFIPNETRQGSSTENDSITTIHAKHTVLATGGLGQVFSRTTNPPVATGDGIALAYQLGAELIDMEFVQFHPTALHLPDEHGYPAFLISEAVRGAGAILLDKNHQRFMINFHKDEELATRDIVSQAIFQTIQDTKHSSVFIDLRPIGKMTLEEKFPNILHRLRDYGIDALSEPVPVSPAAHYFMGGIKAESNGRTSVPFLYAVGECASTGLHGANRLASNSLLEAGVMALKLSKFIGEQKTGANLTKLSNQIDSALMPSSVKPSNLPNLRWYMTENIGICRSEESLGRALDLLTNTLVTSAYSTENIEGANILLLAKLIANTALRRTESRGSHFRKDFPENSSQFARRQVVCKDSYSWVDVRDIKASAH